MSEVALDDAAIARGLISKIGGHCWGGKGDLIDRVYDAVAKRYPTWTRRRIRSFWHGEAARIEFHEIVQLAIVAGAEQRKQPSSKEKARQEHADYIERAARLATALAVADEEFHCEAIEAFGRVASHGDDRKVERVEIERRSLADRRCDPSRVMGAGACG